jgi:hypothetical protein
MDKAVSEILKLVNGKFEKFRNGTTNMGKRGSAELRISIIEEPDGTLFDFQSKEAPC